MHSQPVLFQKNAPSFYFFKIDAPSTFKIDAPSTFFSKKMHQLQFVHHFCQLGIKDSELFRFGFQTETETALVQVILKM